MNLSLYNKLEEIELKNVNGSQLKIISDKLVHMPQIKRLILSFHGTTSDAFKLILTNNIIRSILIKLKLTLTDANLILPTMTDIESFPNVKYLKVDSCRIATLANLCSFFVNINYLDISIWDFPDQNQSYLTQRFQFSNLIYLKLKVDEIKWTFIEHFLKESGEKLKSFTFTGNNDFNFLNPEIWETFITNHLKQLNKFNFHITLWDSSIDSIDLTLFNRDFWRQLNVYVACDLIDDAYEDSQDTIHVYTVPFCNSFLVTGLSSTSVIPPSINAPFKQVQTLMILLDKKPLRNNTKHFYENVNSIIFESVRGHHSNILPFICASVNLEKIGRVGFQSIRGILKTQVFIQLLEQCPNIYSLNLHSKILGEMTNQFSNEKLCLLLKKMIKQIQFNPAIEQEDFDNIMLLKFAQTFTSLERLCIHMKSSQDIMAKLPILLHHIKVLHMFFIRMPQSVPNGLIDQMKQSIVDLKDSYIRKEKKFLCIWR